MKMSRRAKRMQQHYKRKKSNVGLNMVSLMDIFTILVFFLLVNSSDGEVLPTMKSVELPESVSEEKPRPTIVVMVTEKDILVQGRVVAPVEQILQDQPAATGLLQKFLTEQRLHSLQKTTAPGKKVEATIMGDREIPYRLLKKVMASCTESGFERISLAVLQKPLEKS